MNDTEHLLSLYKGILRCMLWEQGLLDMLAEGRISGFFHAGRGQEGVQVGAIAACNNASSPTIAADSVNSTQCSPRAEPP